MYTGLVATLLKNPEKDGAPPFSLIQFNLDFLVITLISSEYVPVVGSKKYAENG